MDSRLLSGYEFNEHSHGTGHTSGNFRPTTAPMNAHPGLALMTARYFVSMCIIGGVMALPTSKPALGEELALRPIALLLQPEPNLVEGADGSFYCVGLGFFPSFGRTIFKIDPGGFGRTNAVAAAPQTGSASPDWRPRF